MKYVYYVLNFILKNRRSGTTTLIKKIAAENDCYVVVRYQQEIKHEYDDIKGKCITLEQLFNFDGLPSKPILFETQAIKELCELAKERFEVVRGQNFKRDVLLQKIKQSLIDFDLSGDNIGSISHDAT